MISRPAMRTSVIEMAVSRATHLTSNTDGDRAGLGDCIERDDMRHGIAGEDADMIARADAASDQFVGKLIGSRIHFLVGQPRAVLRERNASWHSA